MSITNLRKKLKEELKRAELDAEMSADEDDLAYHNGEIDALNFALDFLKELDGVNLAVDFLKER